MSSESLVTCLCLTRNRREWLKKSIECFRAQTYRNRHLLIVADTPADVEGLGLSASAGGLVVLGSEPISVLCLGANEAVGAKRNHGCNAANGEIIAIWDDDDYSAPGRLADQVVTLEQSGKAVTGYRSMKFTDGKSWWLYKGHEGFAMATSLCFRKSWWVEHPFQPIQCGQDEEFANIARAAMQLVSEPDKDLMYATIHPGNTSPRAVNNVSTWTPLPGFEWKDAA